MATRTAHPSTLTRVRIGLALAATGALLTACGSSSKTASSGASSAPSTTPSAAASSKDASSSKAPSTNLGGGSFCEKAKTASANVGGAASGLATDTPDKIKSFEQNALNELKALKSEAPDEIKAPIGTIVDSETTLFNELQAANFDFTKVNSTQITSEFSSPKFTQAISQIDDYLKSKCGIDPSADVTP